MNQVQESPAASESSRTLSPLLPIQNTAPPAGEPVETNGPGNPDPSGPVDQ